MSFPNSGPTALDRDGFDWVVGVVVVGFVRKDLGGNGEVSRNSFVDDISIDRSAIVLGECSLSGDTWCCGWRRGR